ncbi:hypothetical protein AtNW77_Chr3g0158871 [Arabidopsis thaliana]|uniref:Uncharacterized protein n=2 Tax=Arabidopsis TaxID=3701 RepID=A0A8T2EKU4_9BRAS|nr:hypothetical protein ISN45_At03g003660 [Arabidopsis thaliana x Arabidopsis arenosa]OAP02056.1 hypothetical protein AXX17_AT3G03600 [Arabidopsis thaliana]CAD5322028.1 unnamed protein product [Arabidopsis thaliana]
MLESNQNPTLVLLAFTAPISSFSAGEIKVLKSSSIGSTQSITNHHRRSGNLGWLLQFQNQFVEHKPDSEDLTDTAHVDQCCSMCHERSSLVQQENRST